MLDARTHMLVVGVLTCAAMLFGCVEDSPSKGPGTVDSETHWLAPCETDDECGEFACLCGLCTATCDNDSVCEGLGEVSICLGEQSEAVCGTGTETSICYKGCANDNDCRWLGQGATCSDEGRCQEPTIEPEPDVTPEPDPGPAPNPDPEPGPEPDPIELPRQECVDTGGRWDESTCGHYTCGVPSPLGCVDPGCDCGPTANFEDGRGCVSAPQCTVEDGDQALCLATNGRWDEGGCGHFVCAQLPNIDCDEPVPGCNCGDFSNFLPGVGCAPSQLCEQPDDTDVWRLDPHSLDFFFLPINSLRGGVAGWVPEQRACVTVVFDYSNTDRMPVELRCGGLGGGFPYVFIERDAEPPCAGWDYRGNVEVQGLPSGCIDFARVEDPTSRDLIDLAVDVEGELFTGRIQVSSAGLQAEPSIPVGLTYTTDIPEIIYAQNTDGVPAWVQLLRGGEPLRMFDDCTVRVCGEDAPRCEGAGVDGVDTVVSGAFRGQLHTYWDGMIRVPVQGEGCVELVPAPPGEYTASFCVGPSFESIGRGDVVTDSFCREVTFDWPAASITTHFDFGG